MRALQSYYKIEGMAAKIMNNVNSMKSMDIMNINKYINVINIMNKMIIIKKLRY